MKKGAQMELRTVYEIFTKCWFLYKKYHGVVVDDDNVKQLIDETIKIGDGYHCRFSVQLALATLDLLMDEQRERKLKRGDNEDERRRE